VRLTGLPLILLVAAATGLAAVVTWRRWAGSGVLGRTAGALSTQILFVATAGLIANRDQSFYPTWHSLSVPVGGRPGLGIDGAGPVLLGVLLVVAGTAAFAYRARIVFLAAVVLVLPVTCALQLNRLTVAYPSWSSLFGRPASGAALAAGVAPRPGGGRLLGVTVRGTASGLTLPMAVYLPAGYDTSAGDYPVIEVLHGFPGSPRTWIRRLDVAAHLDREIATGRMPPSVVLFPFQTPHPMLDTECTDLAGGPSTETFLTTDLGAWATANLRVRGGRWGLIGYSSGGFCAMNLALRHPGRYAAAASLSGDAGPGIRVGDGSEQTTNNVAWRLRHLPQPGLSLYVTWAADDPESRDGSRLVVSLARAPLSVTAVELPHGGHNLPLWKQMEGPAFSWLATRLEPPGRPHAL
jgi:putative esterase